MKLKGSLLIATLYKLVGIMEQYGQRPRYHNVDCISRLFLLMPTTLSRDVTAARGQEIFLSAMKCRLTQSLRWRFLMCGEWTSWDRFLFLVRTNTFWWQWITFQSGL